MVGVADGGRCEGGVPWVWGGLAGRAVEVWRVHVDVCVVLGGLGWAGRCRVVLWVRGGCADGVLEACGRRWGGVYRAWGQLVNLWVMYGMVMDEMQHAFPGVGAGELLRVC